MPSSALRAGNARPYEFDRTSGGERRGDHWSPASTHENSPSGWPEGEFLTISRFYFANVSMNLIRIMAVSARLAVAFGLSLLLLPFSRPEPTAQRIASAA